MMSLRIPYVIDNSQHRLSDVLNRLLERYEGRALDVATAYFNVGGFDLVRQGVEALSSFRLLLGAEPESGEQLGLRPRVERVRRLLAQDLSHSPFDEKTLRAVEALVAFLRRDSVAVRLFNEGFLHAKCYLFYADKCRPGVCDRFLPVAGIVGSSNFTFSGLTRNRELNLSHKTVLDADELHDSMAERAVAMLSQEDLLRAEPEEASAPCEGASLRHRLKSEVGARAILDLEAWYQTQWDVSRDFKDELIEVLNASKFGEKEYTPYEVYMKALYEYFKDDLTDGESAATRSAVDLAEFQEDAVKRARRILMAYDGVMIADSVGLGKTWIGKKLLEDFAYHMRQKAVVVCPAALRPMWEKELRDATIAGKVLSQEVMGWDTFDATEYQDADVILVDESHNFRNRNSARYENMERLIGGNRGRGREGQRKKVILLTATPINNDLFDLYNQLNLITQGDRAYFAACGIGDLRRHFLQARQASRTGDGSVRLFNLLEEVVIRRTRPFIRKAYPEATIRGKRIHFPERKLRTVTYDLEESYEGLYDEIVKGVEQLNLSPYNLESYKKEGVENDNMEVGREAALVGIFKSRFLKRLESSVAAFRISVERALTFQNTFEDYVLEGKVLKSIDFQKAMRYLDREGEEDDVVVHSKADDLDANEEARQFLSGMKTVDQSKYDLRKLHQAVQDDVTTLRNIWEKVRRIKPDHDAKLQQFKELLQGELKGRKVLVFTYYKDTARYLYEQLGNPKNEQAKAFSDSLGGVTIRRMDGDADAKTRVRIVQEFAPVSNDKAAWQDTDKEIDILFSTDVLSEGQNLQDCGVLVNYDLHWNPTRLVQRAGRVDRIGSQHETLWLYNMFPEEGLEKLLGLVERLSRRIGDIDRAGFLDSSVLGEVVHPQNFNTLRRIRDEDGAVITEEEEFSELASSEMMEQTLRTFMGASGEEGLSELPAGIHSGLVKPGAQGIFFYLQGRPKQGEKTHFWRYYSFKDDSILENRYFIGNLIKCEEDTPRVVAPEDFERVFEIQEKVIEHILQGVEQRQALQAAPRTTDPAQQTASTAIRQYINHPEVDRKLALRAVQFLGQPLLGVQVKTLRQALNVFSGGEDAGKLIEAVLKLEDEAGGQRQGEEEGSPAKERQHLTRDDLHLICFDFLNGG
jgi:superfamily II DNA or RNA helicase